MSNSVIQRSFSAGEISPRLGSRNDQIKYATGLRKLYNGVVMKDGGVQNRSGSIFECEVKDPTKTVRLIPFIFSKSQSYVLEFGDLYIRFIKDGALLTDSTKSIIGITQANPGVFEITAHGFSVNEEVALSGIKGMLGLNFRNFLINTVPDANHVTLKFKDGTPLDTSTLPAYVSGGSASRIYEIESPYVNTDLSEVRFSQSGDIIKMTHVSYKPQELRRLGAVSWSMANAQFVPNFTHNSNHLASGTAGANVESYAVTAINDITGEESLPFTANNHTITAITNAFPAVVTTSIAHGRSNGEMVKLFVYNGSMPEVHQRYFIIANVTPTTYELQGEDSTSYGTFVAGLPAVTFCTWVSGTAAFAGPSVANPVTVSWTDTPGAREYNIYRQVNSVWGLVGISKSLTFKDIGITPDTSKNLPDGQNPFRNVGDYPACVGYVKQRLMYGGSNNQPERIDGSKIGEFENFSKGFPIADDDPVRFKIVGKRVAPVKHIIECGAPFVFTESGEFTLDGDGQGVITPSLINPNERTHHGSSSLRPLIVDGLLIFVQDQGSSVRDLSFDYQIDGYRGNDVTTFSRHFVAKHTLVDWDYQQNPNSVIWLVRNDGILLSLTLERGQQVMGWASHEFEGGTVESVCCIPNSTEDEVHVVVKRTINGEEKRYIERIGSRVILDVVDSVFMDSTIQYDGRNSDGTTMTLTTGTTWTEDDTLTLTSSTSKFESGDVGNEIHFYDGEGTMIFRFSIEAYSSGTVVTGKASSNVPVAFQASPIVTWVKAVDVLYGLSHLEGEDLAVFADRVVVSSPNNPLNETTITVTDGMITLPRCYGVINAGLPFISDFMTLEIDSPQGETMSNNKKNVSAITCRFEETRGVFVGVSEPTGTDNIEGLYELKMREDENYNAPVSLLNGKADINIQSTWNETGQVLIRQVDPLPVTLLSVTAEGMFPVRGR